MKREPRILPQALLEILQSNNLPEEIQAKEEELKLLRAKFKATSSSFRIDKEQPNEA